MENSKKTTEQGNNNKAMEGRQVLKDGTDLKDHKFHSEDMGVDEDVVLENLRKFLQDKDG